METIEEVSRRVEMLWQEHREDPFPRTVYENESVNGESLIMIDTYIAGCISTFLKRSCTLDLWRTAVLGNCYRSVALALVSPDFPEEARPYYSRLETMTGLVLAVVARRAKADDDT